MAAEEAQLGSIWASDGRPAGPNARGRQKVQATVKSMGWSSKGVGGAHKVWGAVPVSIPLLPAQMVSGVLNLSTSWLIDL